MPCRSSHALGQRATRCAESEKNRLQRVKSKYAACCDDRRIGLRRRLQIGQRTAFGDTPVQGLASKPPKA